MKTHIDLFTGIGGFTLAAHWAGFRTVVMCERDEFLRQGLERAWPGIPIVHDIRDFHSKEKRGVFQPEGCTSINPTLLTAGVPCQPASRAGKQRGSADDRWLWPQAIRVLGECQPAWAVFENPPGIGDVGLHGILSDMENQGYQVRVFSIPACAVNAPHRRERYWIVAHSNGTGREELRGSKPDEEKYPATKCSSQGDLAHAGHERPSQPEKQTVGNEQCSQGDMDDTAKTRHHGAQRPPEGDTRDKTRLCLLGSGCENHWSRFVWTPCADGKVRRTPDDSFGLVDGLPRKLLAGLGNSVVPQVAYQIVKAIAETAQPEP